VGIRGSGLAVSIGDAARCDAALLALFERPLDVHAQAVGFLLGDGGEHREDHLGPIVHGVDTLAFEEDRDAHALERPHALEAVGQVARKARNGLDHHIIDLAVLAVLHHPQKLRAAFHHHSRAPSVPIDSYQLKLRIRVNQVAVICALGLIRKLLLL